MLTAVGENGRFKVKVNTPIKTNKGLGESTQEKGPTREEKHQKQQKNAPTRDGKNEHLQHIPAGADHHGTKTDWKKPNTPQRRQTNTCEDQHTTTPLGAVRRPPHESNVKTQACAR